MNVEDIMKENLSISGKKQKLTSERKLGVELDVFVLKYQRQAIYENVKEMLRSHHKRLIKSKRGEDNDEQEGRPTLMITTNAAMREVCVVEEYRER